MKRSVTIGLAAGTVALAVALWLGASWLLQSAPGGGAAAAPTRPDGTAPSAGRPAQPPLETADGTGAANRERSAGEGTERQALGSRVQLRVVERGSGRPLPDAQVLAWVGSGFPGVDRVWGLATIDDWMAEHGRPLPVAADGSAWLAVPAGEAALVVGSTPGRWGRAVLQAGVEEPQLLALGPDASLTVRTVDPRGVPRAGIEVALRQTEGPWSQDPLRRTTDAEGEAVLLHAGALLAETELGEGGVWSLVADVVLAEPVEQRLDPDALPTAPIVLVVPATGSVELAVRALPGGPSPEGGEAALLRLEDGQLARPAFWEPHRRWAQPIRDGVARFEHVGLGLELAAEARGLLSTAPTRRTLQGPLSAGEVRRVELVLGSDHPVLRIRLLDAKGEPLASAGVRAELEQTTVSSSTFHREQLRSDPAGVLFVDLAPGWVEGHRRSLTLTTQASDLAPAASVTLDLSRRFADGLNDLGDVHLVAGERLAAGRVEDPSGAPVSGARVAVQVSKEWAGDTPWFERRPDLDATTDERGAFEVRGALESQTLRLVPSFEEEGYVGDPQEVSSGATGVVLRLGRAGSVAGRVLVDEGVALAPLSVQLHPASGFPGDRGVRRSVGSLREEGTFALQGLYPGPYDLVVRVRESGEELASIEGLVVPAGAPSPDPRLAAIDLRGKLCSFTLTLVPPHLRSTLSGVVLVRPSGGDPASEQTRYFVGERVAFTAVAPALDLEVLAQGCRRLRLEGVRVDTRVELEQGPRVRLRLAPGLELPRPPLYLKAFVGSEQDFWTLGHMQDAAFGSDRELVVHVAEPGRLQVLWMLEERHEDSLSTTSLGEEQPRTVEVLDLPGEQVFDVAPDPGAYARALERWQPR